MNLLLDVVRSFQAVAYTNCIILRLRKRDFMSIPYMPKKVISALIETRKRRRVHVRNIVGLNGEINIYKYFCPYLFSLIFPSFSQVFLLRILALKKLQDAKEWEEGFKGKPIGGNKLFYSVMVECFKKVIHWDVSNT